MIFQVSLNDTAKQDSDLPKSDANIIGILKSGSTSSLSTPPVTANVSPDSIKSNGHTLHEASNGELGT